MTKETKTAIVASLLLFITLNAFLWVGTVLIGRMSFSTWLAFPLAQILGAMQALLFYTLMRKK